MRISTSLYHSRATEAIINQQSKTAELQNKIATGKKVLSPADDPISSARILSLKQQLDMSEQYQKNTIAAMQNLELTESVLGGVNSVLQRVSELAIQANSGGLSYADRISVASELEQRLFEITSSANTKDANGDYIFSGFKLKQPTVKLNSAGNYVYNGDGGQRKAQVSAATQIAISESGKNCFYDIPTSTPQLTKSNSLALVTSSASGLQTAGSLNALQTNSLVINGVNIPKANHDLTSTTDASASAIAIANTINSKFSETNVTASVNPNVVNLGTFSVNNLSAGDLTLNGTSIIANITNNDELVAAINAKTLTTGIVASNNAGDIVLTAADGRNIQLQTTGSSLANFANFNLTAGAINNVARSSVTLISDDSIALDGANVAYADLSLGTTEVTANTSPAIMSEPIVIAKPKNIPETYYIRFNALSPNPNYSIYAASNPNSPIADYANIEYQLGDDILIDGIKVSFDAIPLPNDNYTITIDTKPAQDLFTSMQNLIYAIKNYSDDSTRLDYEIGLGLDNLSNAEDKILEVRSKVGSRLNVLNNQKQVNTDFILLAESALSQLEDLDYAGAISELQQQTLSLQAAQQSYMKIQNLNLFNFL